jgi:hypothetical protein
MPLGDKSLTDIDARLSDVAHRFRICLTNLQARFSVIVAQNTGLHALMTEADKIQERLIAIQFAIVKFHKKPSEEETGGGGDTSQRDDFTRKIVAAGYQSWVNDQVEYIQTAIQSVIELFTMETDAKGS